MADSNGRYRPDQDKGTTVMIGPQKLEPSELVAIGRDAYTVTPKTGEQMELESRKGDFYNFLLSVGCRYKSCRLDNFTTAAPKQKEVVDALTNYAQEFESELCSGTGIVLFGPPGTGKDHLLVGTAAKVLQVCKYRTRRVSIKWINGVELFGMFRDAIKSDTSEGDIVAKFTCPTVLIVSDPVPPYGALTEFQAATLFRIIDARYRAMLPTWASLNVATGQEAEERVGAAVVDRLRDNAIVAFCNWPSHRKSRTVGTETCIHP